MAKFGIFSYESLVHAISGGCGSAVAMSALFPLDTVRTRLQLEDENCKDRTVLAVLKEIYIVEGIQGLYRGLLPVIESLYCSNFVYFYTFHGLKRVANHDQSAFKDLILAMIAGSINVLTTNPLWVVNTRIKMQGTNLEVEQENGKCKYNGMIDGLIKVFQKEGIAGLWTGSLSSLILVINPAIQFMCYEAIKRRLVLISGSQQLDSSAVFLVGAAAKAVATILTYPIQLVQTKQRHGHKYENLPEKAGIVHMVCYILRKQGFFGLFKGLEAKIMQTVLTAALMFVCYEKIVSFVFAVLMRSRKISSK